MLSRVVGPRKRVAEQGSGVKEEGLARAPFVQMCSNWVSMQCNAVFVISQPIRHLLCCTIILRKWSPELVW